MAQNTKRLNLADIVDKHLQQSMEGEKYAEFFSANYVNTEVKSAKQEVEVRARSPFRKTNIMTSLQSVVNTVHNKLRNKPKELKVEPLPTTIEAPLVEAPPEEKPEEVKAKPTVKRDKQPKPHLHTSPVRARSPPKVCTIPQIKANLEQKSQQRMRRIPPHFDHTNNFTHQTRIKEVMRQKRLLEDMLSAHEKLRRDRVTIAGEIQRMRSHLNDIRVKLDTSLKKLNSNSTYIERYPRQVKKKVHKNPNRSYTLGQNSAPGRTNAQRPNNQKDAKTQPTNVK